MRTLKNNRPTHGDQAYGRRPGRDQHPGLSRFKKPAPGSTRNTEASERETKCETRTKAHEKTQGLGWAGSWRKRHSLAQCTCVPSNVKRRCSGAPHPSVPLTPEERGPPLPKVHCRVWVPWRTVPASPASLHKRGLFPTAIGTEQQHCLLHLCVCVPCVGPATPATSNRWPRTTSSIS